MRNGTYRRSEALEVAAEAAWVAQEALAMAAAAEAVAVVVVWARVAVAEKMEGWAETVEGREAGVKLEAEQAEQVEQAVAKRALVAAQALPKSLQCRKSRSGC